MLSPDTIVDRYRVEEELGRGACAVVYRVRHTRLNSPHALKLLLWKSPSLRKRLLQEGQVQASLQHPNVVPVTDVVEHGEMMALVMPYIDGPDLEQWLDGRSVDVETAEALIREIISGLSAAHSRGVIHRDLKPANILMQQIDDRWVPRISDFGIARLLTEGESGLTRLGAALGTPGYMAPEQFRDGRSAGVRADIFAVGCILYEMLLGVRAFQGQSMAAIELSTSSGAYTPPEVLNPRLPERIQRAIRGCLIVDPEQRLPDCATLLRVLDGGEWTPTSEVPTARPETLVPSASAPGTWLPQSPPARSRWPMVLGVAGLLLGGLLLRQGLSGPPEAPEALSEQPPAAVDVLEQPAPVEPPPAQPVEATTPPEAQAPAAGAPTAPAAAVPAEPVAEAPAEPVEPAVTLPPRPSTAQVRIHGDAQEVWLEKNGQRQDPGRVPTGSYTVFARLSDVGTISAARTLQVEPGDSITLTCSTAFMGCKW